MILSSLRRGLSPLLLALLVPLALGQAPALPDGLATDPRLSWRPTLGPVATATVSASGVVEVWRTGSPVPVPTAGREPILVAIDQLANDAGEWVGIYGSQGSVSLGLRTDKNDTARPSGYSGISIVGLDSDPSSSDWARIGGFTIGQAIGVQRDVAFLALTIDSWSDRPCQTIDSAFAPISNLYLESVRILAISNNRKDQTAKGDNCTKWPLKIHGAYRQHLLNVELLDGVDVGDGLGGASEHFNYSDALYGPSEFLDLRIRGAKISALYFTTRYRNRLQRPDGTWAERFSYGPVLIDNLWLRDVGELGSWAVNICGGAQDVVVRDPDYRVNLDSPGGPAPKWLGGFLQVYVDRKQYERDEDDVAGGYPTVALGYSMETGSLPMSPGIQELVDSGAYPWDGYGGARTLRVEGGRYQAANLVPPLFNLRDVRRVVFVESVPEATPFRASGVGKTIAFASSGIRSQCGPAQIEGGGPGLIPASLGAGWNQQALFLTRRRPSVVFGTIKIGSTTIPALDMDSWAGR